MRRADAMCDERLLRRVREGDEVAFAAILGRYESALTRHCARVAGTAHAQDAVQETFLAAWRALRAGASVEALRPWLFTIAHRKALDFAQPHALAYSELTETLPSAAPTVEVAERSAALRGVLSAVAALPALERDALVASAVQGRSGRQLARRLGVEEPTVRQLVHRGRERVRAAAAACLLPPIALLRRLGLSNLPVAGSPALTGGGAVVRYGAAALAGATILGSGTAMILHQPVAHHRDLTAAASVPAPAPAQTAAVVGAGPIDRATHRACCRRHARALTPAPPTVSTVTPAPQPDRPPGSAATGQAPAPTAPGGGAHAAPPSASGAVRIAAPATAPVSSTIAPSATATPAGQTVVASAVSAIAAPVSATVAPVVASATSAPTAQSGIAPTLSAVAAPVSSTIGGSASTIGAGVDGIAGAVGDAAPSQPLSGVEQAVTAAVSQVVP
jgi:RNA polymerase sigma factor (sigma-70 family)